MEKAWNEIGPIYLDLYSVYFNVIMNGMLSMSFEILHTARLPHKPIAYFLFLFPTDSLMGIF